MIQSCLQLVVQGLIVNELKLSYSTSSTMSQSLSNSQASSDESWNMEPSKSTIADISACLNYQRNEQIKFDYQWQIDYQHNEEFLEKKSPHFPDTADIQFSVKINLDPDELFFHLILEFCKKTEIQVKFQFTMFDSQGRQFCKESMFVLLFCFITNGSLPRNCLPNIKAWVFY